MHWPARRSFAARHSCRWWPPNKARAGLRCPRPACRWLRRTPSLCGGVRLRGRPASSIEWPRLFGLNPRSAGRACPTRSPRGAPRGPSVTLKFGGISGQIATVPGFIVLRASGSGNSSPPSDTTANHHKLDHQTGRYRPYRTRFGRTWIGHCRLSPSHRPEFPSYRGVSDGGLDPRSGGRTPGIE